jgi:hypothetical protein
VQIPAQDQFLLFQTIRGAIDIVPGEIARELSHFGNSKSGTLNEAEIESLKKRGYLTELSAAQEQEQVRTILRVLAEKLQSNVELTFHFPDSPKSTHQDLSDTADLIENLFLLANKIAGEQGGILTHLETSSTPIDPQLITRILDQAHNYNSLVLPRLPITALKELRPWLKSENFRHVSLVSKREDFPLDVETTVDEIINAFNHQVYPSWQGNITGMSEKQLEALLLIFERVRQKYPFFALHLVSDAIAETAIDNWVSINGTSLPYINPKNAAVLNTLLTFVLMPNRINYTPFFAPGPHKLNCVLGTEQVTYESPSGEELVGEFDQVQMYLKDLLTRSTTNAIETAALIQESSACRYALICGCSAKTNECTAGLPQCTAVYEQRLQQVLPLFLFNLQKTRHRAAGA